MAALRDDSVPRAMLLQSHELREFRPRSALPSYSPLAHPIAVHYCAVDLSLAEDGVEIRSTVRTADRTGIEMEALTAVTVAALTIIDMVNGASTNWLRFVSAMSKKKAAVGAEHGLAPAPSTQWISDPRRGDRPAAGRGIKARPRGPRPTCA